MRKDLQISPDDGKLLHLRQIGVNEKWNHYITKFKISTIRLSPFLPGFRSGSLELFTLTHFLHLPILHPHPKPNSHGTIGNSLYGHERSGREHQNPYKLEIPSADGQLNPSTKTPQSESKKKGPILIPPPMPIYRSSSIVVASIFYELNIWILKSRERLDFAGEEVPWGRWLSRCDLYIYMVQNHLKKIIMTYLFKRLKFLVVIERSIW